MQPKTMVLKLIFDDLDIKEKVEFVEWLHLEHKDYIEFSALTESERKVWAHYFFNISEAFGYNTTDLSGSKTGPIC